MSDAPIGVFDSGIGGLTVARAIAQRLPHENIVYLGDTARLPYGTKSAETVVKYALRCVQFLAQQPLKAVVIACNSASAVAVPTLRAHFEMPILGVIGPGARAAVSRTQNQRIGVIGTEGTIRSQSYPKRIHAIDPEVQVFSNAAPMLVPLAEEGWTDGQVPQLIVENYVAPLLAHQIDTLVLGCTHYPLFKGLMQRWLQRQAAAVALVDSAEVLTSELHRLLETSQALRRPDMPGTISFNVTDDPVRFAQVGRSFFGAQLQHVHLVDL